ncbi:MAG TPA: hypothetical protein DDY13_06790 [Cytophagales bacterium]|jgi:GWxTD domain-containing protein|nr:hypothetical protein [Cytophagales bacterium]
MRTFAILFCLLLALIINQVSAQHSFTSLNVAYQYDINGKILLHHQLFHKEDSAQVLLAVTSTDSSFLSNYDVLVEIRDGFKDAEIHTDDTLNERYLIGKKGLTSYYSYQFEYKSKYTLMVIDFFNKGTGANYTYHISIGEKANYSDDGLYVIDAETGLPELSGHLVSGKPYVIKCIKKDADKVFSYSYKNNFEIALPPMVIEDRNVNKSLEVREIQQIRIDDTLAFDQKGLYLVQIDTNGVLGLPFRVVEKGFPKYYYLDDLLDPLTYIVSREEREEIQGSEDPRLAFERFWIENCRSKSVARRAIKAYYDRIAAANLYFTNYKSGWKTDMGMIYTIYGPPDEVYVEEEYETWQYTANRSLPSIRFTFVKVKNIFADRYYVLVRDRKFDRHWFRTVELWREGKQAE